MTNKPNTISTATNFGDCGYAVWRGTTCYYVGFSVYQWLRDHHFPAREF